MSKIYFTTGPTEIYGEIKGYYEEAFDRKLFSISHRSQEFSDICRETTLSLKALLNIPDDFYVFYLGSATECMERVIENLVREKSFHFVNGYFAYRFYEISQKLKKSAEAAITEYGKPFEINNIRVPKNMEIICITHNETSTGAAFPNELISKIREKNKDKLLFIDAVTSLPYSDFNYYETDGVFFSVQKGFGMPPGLGVLIIRKSCIEKTRDMANEGYNIGTFHNFVKLADYAEKYQTGVTPNIPAIYTLGKICRQMISKGIQNIRQETLQKAELTYNFFDNHDSINPFITDKDWRSMTTIVLSVNCDVNSLIKKLENNGIVVNKGYKDFREKQIRIGNFPVHTKEDFLNLIYYFKKF